MNRRAVSTVLSVAVSLAFMGAVGPVSSVAATPT
jgi:hypothetical protein